MGKPTHCTLALALVLASTSFAAADETIKLDAEALGKTTLCTDGKSHYVAVGPHPLHIHTLYYGDGKKFVVVPAEPTGQLSGDSFLDPRFFNKNSNENFRGVDCRVYSDVQLDTEKNTCAVTCGERKIPMTVVAADKAAPMLKAATFLPNPQKFVPYALARDDRGTYYYVDRGSSAQTEKNFRLFVGQKGNLKQQKMTNVVSDSEGDIFSTPTGSLRMIIEKHTSTWIESEKKRDLKLVPVTQNLPMIYGELGVYAGQRLGTPCDDL